MTGSDRLAAGAPCHQGHGQGQRQRDGCDHGHDKADAQAPHAPAPDQASAAHAPLCPSRSSKIRIANLANQPERFRQPCRKHTIFAVCSAICTGWTESRARAEVDYHAGLQIHRAVCLRIRGSPRRRRLAGPALAPAKWRLLVAPPIVYRDVRVQIPTRPRIGVVPHRSRD
jgi:hypothetical protein